MVNPARSTVNNYCSSKVYSKVKAASEQERETEEAPVSLFNGLTLLSMLPSSRKIELLIRLFENPVQEVEGKKVGVIDEKGELIGKFKDKALPPLNESQTKCLRDELFRQFEVKDTAGSVIKKVSIGELLIEFLKSIPEDYEVTEINLIGGYLIDLLLYQSDKYLDDLFDSDFPNEIKEHLKAIVKSKPTDIDIRIKLRHKTHGDVFLKGKKYDELNDDIIEKIFLKDLASIKDILFKKWAPIDNGINQFSIAMLEGTDIELIFSVKSLRDNLFFLDGYKLSIKELLGSADARPQPAKHERCKMPCLMQGIIDNVLGVLRAEDELDMEADAFFRLISKITKGICPAQKGLTEALRKKLWERRNLAYYLKEIGISLNSHHSLDPREQFAYLFNFTYFAGLSNEETKILWGEFYNKQVRPNELWMKLAIDQIVDKEIPFSKVLATLNTGFYLCLAGEAVSAIDIEMDQFEGEREVFKVKLGSAALQSVHDKAHKLNFDDDQLELLHSMMEKKEGAEFDHKTDSPHDEPPNLDLYSCFLKKDMATCLRSLLIQAKSSIDKDEIDLSAKIALSIIAKDIKGDNFISRELVNLITKTSDQEIAQKLMALGIEKNLIIKNSREISLGQLHFIKKHHEKDPKPEELFKMYQELLSRGEIAPIDEVKEFYTDLLNSLVLKQPLEKIFELLALAPMDENERQQFVNNTWLKIGKKAIADGDGSLVKECAAKVNSLEGCSFLLDAANFFAKSGEVEEAIQTVEQSYSLDKSGEFKGAVKHLAFELLYSSREFKKSLAMLLNFILQFKALFNEEDDLPKLGIFSCFLEKDITASLRSLLLQVKPSKDQGEIDLAANLSLHMISQEVRGDDFISRELVNLITKTSDQEIAQKLMALGTKKNLIKKESQERVLGWLHFLKKYHKKHQNPDELFDRYQKLAKKRELLPIPEVIEFYSDLLKNQVLKQSFEKTLKWLSNSPMNEEMRQQFIVDMVGTHLEDGDLQLAIKAINKLNEKREELLENAIKYLETSPKKSLSDFIMVEELFGSFPKLSEERVFSLVSRMISASASLDRKERWLPKSDLFKRFLAALQEVSFVPTTANIDLIVGIIDNMRSLTSTYRGLKGMVEKLLPKLVTFDDRVDTFSYYHLLSGVKRIYYTFKWSSDDVKKINTIWSLIGKDAIARDDSTRVMECVEEIHSIEGRDFLLEAAEFLIKKNKIDDAIKTFEKGHSLDKSAIDKVWKQFAVCIKNIKLPIRRSRLLLNSPIPTAAKNKATDVVKKCMFELLQPSKLSKKSTLQAFELFFKFKGLFGKGDESILLDLLKALDKYYPEKITSAFHIIDPKFSNDPKLQQEGRLLALPKLLAEKDEVILQFITGETVLTVDSRKTVKEIDKVAIEIAVKKTSEEREPILKVLWDRNRLNLEGKMMLFKDYFFSDQNEKVEESLKILSDIIQSEYEHLSKYFSSNNDCSAIFKGLICLNEPPVGLILHLSQFIEKEKLKEVKILPLISYWLRNRDKIELSKTQIIALLNIVEISYTNGDMCAKDGLVDNMDAILRAVNSFVLNQELIKGESILNDGKLLNSILRIYKIFFNGTVALKPQNDDFFWQFTLSAINPQKCSEYLNLLSTHYDFIVEMLQKREVLDSIQENVISQMLVNLPFLLSKNKNHQSKLSLLRMLEDFNKRAKKQDIVLEWLTHFINSVCSKTVTLDYGLLYYVPFVLEKLIIPRFSDRPEVIISLIEKFQSRLLELVADDTLPVEQMGYVNLYRSLSEYCLKLPNSIELFQKICAHFCNYGRGEKEVDFYCCPKHTSERQPKRMVLSILFDTIFNNLLTKNSDDILSNQVEYEKCCLLISFVCEIFSQGWFLQKIESAIEMTKLMLPYLGCFFANAKQGYNEELDLVLETLKLFKKFKQYLSSENAGKKNVQIPLPKSFSKQGKKGEKVAVKDIIHYYEMEVATIIRLWNKIVLDVSERCDTAQAKKLPELALSANKKVLGLISELGI